MAVSLADAPKASSQQPKAPVGDERSAGEHPPRKRPSEKPPWETSVLLFIPLILSEVFLPETVPNSMWVSLEPLESHSKMFGGV